MSKIYISLGALPDMGAKMEGTRCWVEAQQAKLQANIVYTCVGRDFATRSGSPGPRCPLCARKAKGT